MSKFNVPIIGANRSGNNWNTIEQQLVKLKQEVNELDIRDGYSKDEIDDMMAEKADATDVEEALDDKVDKVEGKGLSSNDYTDAEKEMLAEHDTEIGELQEGLEGKVDKEDGKGLSSNDFTDGYKVQISDNTNRIADAETRLAGHDADITRIDNEIGSLDATKADQESLEEETQARLEAESQLQEQIDDKADSSDLDDYIKKTDIQDDGAIEYGPNGLRVKVDGQTIVIANGQLKAIVQGGGGGGDAYWGGITGNIQNQTDLIAELKKKITYGADVPPTITTDLRNTIYVYTGPDTEEEPIYKSGHTYFSQEVEIEGVMEWKWIDITASQLKPLEEKDASQDERMTEIEANLQDETDARTGGDEALASRISAVENELPTIKDDIDDLEANKMNKAAPTEITNYDTIMEHGTSFNVNATSQFAFRAFKQENNVVTINIGVNISAPSLVGSPLTFGKLKSGYVPKGTNCVIGVLYNVHNAALYEPVVIRIKNDGILEFYNLQNIESYTRGGQLFFNISYVAQ